MRIDRGGKAPASTISAALANAPLSPPLSNHGSSPQPFSVSCFIIIWFSLRGMVTARIFFSSRTHFLVCFGMAYEASILHWACGFAALARAFTMFFTIAGRDRGEISRALTISFSYRTTGNNVGTSPSQKPVSSNSIYRKVHGS